VFLLMEWAEGSRDCICNILVLSMGYIKTDLFCLTQSQDEQIHRKWQWLSSGKLQGTADL
jgi:hypothetical protein